MKRRLTELETIGNDSCSTSEEEEEMFVNVSFQSFHSLPHPLLKLAPLGHIILIRSQPDLALSP